ncbi:hypothetical protein AVEN_171646-1 [Araneus ventricosus]|uniref:Uncharacterized protein n=1 Tax=Araneus ventricosus TaxID=182803 RepID=A0A4Y2F3G0_ARAVE|nr:hypothetical protein AVEN_171646-1 [Araneus ventricosus]
MVRRSPSGEMLGHGEGMLTQESSSSFDHVSKLRDPSQNRTLIPLLSVHRIKIGLEKCVEKEDGASWSRESTLFATGHGPFPSYLYRFRLHHSDICACGEKGDPLHYATSCHMTLSYHLTKSSAENTQLSWKSLLSNKLSRINIAKFISSLTENENLIKQPPDATSSSDSDLDFSPSPRPQTYGLRPSRGSIPRNLISPPTSI